MAFLETFDGAPPPDEGATPAAVHDSAPASASSSRERAIRILKEHWPLLLLLGIMAAAFLIRLFYLSRHTEYTADSYYFLILARSIRDTFTYTVRGVAHTKYLPGYPVAIWLGSYIFGGLERSANMIALIGATLTVWVSYLLGKELFNKWVGLVAALIIAFQPTFLKWTSLPMTEGMFTFLFSGGVYLLITGCRRASPGRRLLGAAAGGLCLLTRWEGVLFLPIMALIVIIYVRGSRLRWWEPVLMLAVFGLPTGLYVVRNLVATGKITAYSIEYQQHKEITFALLKHRAKVYGWQGMSDAMFYIFFYIGSAWCLARRRWKAFLVVFGWFFLFVVFHMFWYYSYERFMAPAAPAVAMMIGFLLVELATGVRYLFGSEGTFNRRLAGGRMAERARRGLTVSLQLLGYAVVAGLLVMLVTHGLVRANSVISENYRAFADDHGGKGMAQAAEWLVQNAPGQQVAADAGPLFNWEYNADVLYVRPVPWDLPVEAGDVVAPYLTEKLYQRGVRYLVVGQTEQGVEAELTTIGMRPEDLERIREVARWTNHYDYPEPHDLTTVIFEVLPPP